MKPAAPERPFSRASTSTETSKAANRYFTLSQPAQSLAHPPSREQMHACPQGWDASRLLTTSDSRQAIDGIPHAQPQTRPASRQNRRQSSPKQLSYPHRAHQQAKASETNGLQRQEKTIASVETFPNSPQHTLRCLIRNYIVNSSRNYYQTNTAPLFWRHSFSQHSQLVVEVLPRSYATMARPPRSTNTLVNYIFKRKIAPQMPPPRRLIRGARQDAIRNGASSPRISHAHHRLPYQFFSKIAILEVDAVTPMPLRFRFRRRINNFVPLGNIQ